MGYSYYRTVTIDHTKVSGDLSDHPFVFATTHDDLRTVGNGGHVTSASGYDIVFSPNTDGSSPYAHELERYVVSTGQYVAHVKIPSISSSVDTVFYIVYGNSDIVASQEDITGVWDANFSMVQHFHGSAWTNMRDSTSNDNDPATVEGNPTHSLPGLVGKCVELDGNDAFTLGNDASLSPEAGAFTIEAWIRTTHDPGAAYEYLWIDYNGTPRVALALYDDQKATGYFRDGEGDESAAQGQNLNFDDDVWHHALYTRSGTTVDSYWDGALRNDAVADDPNLGTISVNGEEAPRIGSLTDAASFYTGKIDEMRISKGIARSAHYALATYNNFSSPGTFYALGTEQSPAQGKNVSDTAAGAEAIVVTVALSITDTGEGAGEVGITAVVPISDPGTGTDVVAIASCQHSRKITIDHARILDDLTDFPFLFNTAHDNLRTVGNGGDVTNGDGYDIIFSPNSDGTSPYDHEIEEYDAVAGKFVAHVRIPFVSASVDTVFYICYGCSGITTSQENITGVWGSDFRMVLHLKESAGHYLDSTEDGNDSTVEQVTSRTETGIAGPCPDFDGADDYLNMGEGNGTLDFGNSADFTLEAWVKIPTVSAAQVIIEKRPVHPFTGYSIDLGSTGVLSATIADGTNSAQPAGTEIDDDSFHYVVLVCDRDGNAAFYVDGVAAGTPASMALVGDIDNAQDLWIGRRAHNPADPGRELDGFIDEVRVSYGLRSASYIWATWNNFSSPGTFYILGSAVQDTGSGAETLAITVAVSVSDTGEGVDAVTLATPIDLSDSGVGAEGIAIAVSLAVSDSGVGTGDVSTPQSYIADEGTGVDVVSAITVDLAISDTAVGAGSVSVARLVPLSDSGIGSESISVTVSLDVTDSGVGSEVAASAIDIAEADTATGSESIVVEATISVSDDGAGVGALAIAVVTSLADTVEGTDSLVNDGNVGVIGRSPQDHIHLDTTSVPTQTYHITKWKPISHRMMVIEHSVHGGTIAHAISDLQYRMWEIEMLLTQSELAILRADLAASHLFYFRAIDHSPGHPSEDIIRVYATQMPSEEFIDPLLQKARVKLVLMEDPW